MCAGGVLAYLVLIPMIKFFGDGLPAPLAARHHRRSREMSPDEIRGAYVLYIGAGAVAAGGIISLLRSLPHHLARPARGPARRRRPRDGAARRPGRAPTATCRSKFVFVGIGAARARHPAVAARCT